MQLWRDQETAIQCSRCFLECLVTSPQVPQQSQLTEDVVSRTLRVTIRTSSKYCQVVWLPSYTHRTRSASRVLGDRSRVIFHPEKVALFAGKRQLGTFSMGLAEENPCTSWECGCASCQSSRNSSCPLVTFCYSVGRALGWFQPSIPDSPILVTSLMKYHSPSIRRLSLLVASHITVCLWGVTSALGVT
jgi:hypothetical protein